MKTKCATCLASSTKTRSLAEMWAGTGHWDSQTAQACIDTSEREALRRILLQPSPPPTLLFQRREGIAWGKSLRSVTYPGLRAGFGAAHIRVSSTLGPSRKLNKEKILCNLKLFLTTLFRSLLVNELWKKLPALLRARAVPDVLWNWIIGFWSSS